MVNAVRSIGALLGRHRELDSDTSQLDVEILLGRVTGRDRASLRTWPEWQLSTAQLREFDALYERRRRGEPIAYILGTRDFWSLSLQVSPRTLIPRPETETLVAAALDLLDSGCLRVLDLGTGSGAVALALAQERPTWRIDAVDIDGECVRLADANAGLHGLRNVRCWQSDWYENVSTRYHLIVANPPYIAADDEHLQHGDLRYEPRGALVAGEGGMGDIRAIISEARRFLKRDGWLMLEHGFDQGTLCARLLGEAAFSRIASLQDLAGQDRVTLGQCAYGE